MSYALVDRAVVLQELRSRLSDSEIDILRRCLCNSDKVYTGYVDGKVACTWGLVPPTLLSNEAYIWLYHNELVEKHKFLFVRNSQRAVEEMLKEYSSLRGHAQGCNACGIQWLKWLGAKFGEEVNGMIAFTIEQRNG